MSERLGPLTTICIGETEDKFFVAAKAPLDAESAAFNRLDMFAQSVHDLKEGSQVFVYEKTTFGGTPYMQEEGIKRHIDEVAEEVGSMAVYPTIRQLQKSSETLSLAA